MTTLLLLALLALQTDPVVINFDATKVGELPPEIKTADKSSEWIVSSDPKDTSNNRFLTLRDDHTPFGQCLLNIPVSREFELSFRAQFQPGKESASEALLIVEMRLPPSGQLFWLEVSGNLKATLIPVHEGETKFRVPACDSALFQESPADKWIHINIKCRDQKLTVSNESSQMRSCVLNQAAKPTGKEPSLGFQFGDSKGSNIHIDDITIRPLPPELSQILQIRGMTCELCEAKIEAALKAVKGVKDAKASHKEGSCTVTLDENAPPDIKDLIKAVEDIHYHATTEGA